MAGLMEIVRQWEAGRKKRQELEKAGDHSGLPWPTYNGGKQFCCEQCWTHFDTSAGFAKHQVYGCDYNNPPTPAKSLSSCAKCGSYYLYPEKDGRVTCMTCEVSQ